MCQLDKLVVIDDDNDPIEELPVIERLAQADSSVSSSIFLTYNVGVPNMDIGISVAYGPMTQFDFSRNDQEGPDKLFNVIGNN